MHQHRANRCARVETLESRQLLAVSSAGWDGPGRGSADLTYYVGETPAYLDRASVNESIREALDAWEDVIDVSFQETQIPRQHDSLDITFRQIDGPGGTLAQAYFPDDVNSSRIAGDIQFDTSETWEIGNQQGARAFDLTLVAVHEIGHALGLHHSHAHDSVMRDSVSALEQFHALSPGDVDHALELYAASVPPVASPPESTPTQADPHQPTSRPTPLAPQPDETSNPPRTNRPSLPAPRETTPTYTFEPRQYSFRPFGWGRSHFGSYRWSFQPWNRWSAPQTRWTLVISAVPQDVALRISTPLSGGTSFTWRWWA